MKYILFLILPLAIATCEQQEKGSVIPPPPPMSDYEASVYNETLEEVKKYERRLADVSSYSIFELGPFLSEVKSIRYQNDTTGMSASDKESCMKLERRIDILKNDALAATEQRVRTIRIPAKIENDCLLEKTTAYPVYLERGDILYYTIALQKPATVKLYNADAQALLKTHSMKAKVTDSLVIANKGIYLVEIVPGGTQYTDVDITYQMADHFHPAKTVTSEEVESKAGAFRVVSNKGIVMKPAFNEPRKFTLSSQLKSSFSSAAKSIAVVAVQIPSGTTEILYNLRISTSERDRFTDGTFPENMNNSYKKVRFLGLPIYESTRSSGLLNTLLDDNRPLREADAYCNMYVFRTQWTAKQFQDGTKQASQLQYDVDYSTLGTQSCNGRIPVKGAKTIYLAFENERVRYSNYIWVEVLTATPSTEYHTTRYSIEP